MHLVDARLLGKVNLSPIPGSAQLPDSLARRLTDVLRHAFIIWLAFALYLAHTLFEVPKVAIMPLHRKIAFTLLVSIALFASGCGGGSGSSGGGGTGDTSGCAPGVTIKSSGASDADGVDGEQRNRDHENGPGVHFRHSREHNEWRDYL